MLLERQCRWVTGNEQIYMNDSVKSTVRLLRLWPKYMVKFVSLIISTSYDGDVLGQFEEKFATHVVVADASEVIIDATYVNF